MATATTVPAAELTRLTATQIAARVASGEVSAREVVDAHIARIEAVDPIINAVVARRFEGARADADAIDAARARGERLGPLAGVPMTVKEQWDVAGLPTTFGLPSRKSHRAAKDAPLIERLRNAGACLLGKTNTPQLLFYQESDNPLYGLTKNPWQLDRTPGGGTGGEGAIIAAGGSAIGLATDIGGSIRIPGHFNAVAGLKPTTFRLTTLGTPREFFFPGFYEVMLDSGPFARSVEDLGVVMEVLAAPGLERIDPRIPPVPWPDYRAVPVQGLRVGYFDDDGYFPCSPAVRRVVHEAAEALRARGAEVVPFEPPNAREATEVYFAMLAGDRLAWVKPHLRGNPVDKRIKGLVQISHVPDFVKPALGALLRSFGQERMAETLLNSKELSARDFQDQIVRRDRYRDMFFETMDRKGVDVILAPPYPTPAVTHGATFFMVTAVSYSVLFNVLGMPTGVLPASRVRAGEESDRPASKDLVWKEAQKVERGSAGLPVGLQVAGRIWREDVVLSVMAALEEHFKAQPDYPHAPPI